RAAVRLAPDPLSRYPVDPAGGGVGRRDRSDWRGRAFAHLSRGSLRERCGGRLVPGNRMGSRRDIGRTLVGTLAPSPREPDRIRERSGRLSAPAGPTRRSASRGAPRQGLTCCGAYTLPPVRRTPFRRAV